MHKRQNIKAPGHSPECEGEPYYYDGALGYEAMKCDVCGYELDLNAEANAKATAERLASQPPAHLPTLEETSRKLHDALLWQERTQMQAEALAEALRELVRTIDRDNLSGRYPIAQAKAALADCDKAQS